MAHIDDVPRPDAAVQLAVALIAHTRGAGSVAAVARATKCSPRRLRQLFAEHVGMTPKELARIIRLRSAAAGHVVGGASWLDVAAEQGFSDQPHLVREFRSILGVTPSQFASHAKRIAHRLVCSRREKESRRFLQDFPRADDADSRLHDGSPVRFDIFLRRTR